MSPILGRWPTHGRLQGFLEDKASMSLFSDMSEWVCRSVWMEYFCNVFTHAGWWPERGTGKAFLLNFSHNHSLIAEKRDMEALSSRNPGNLPRVGHPLKMGDMASVYRQNTTYSWTSPRNLRNQRFNPAQVRVWTFLGPPKWTNHVN